MQTLDCPSHFPQHRGRNSGLMAFGLICDDISAFLKNIGPEKVMLEHPEEQVSCLQGQSSLNMAPDLGQEFFKHGHTKCIGTCQIQTFSVGHVTVMMPMAAEVNPLISFGPKKISGCNLIKEVHFQMGNARKFPLLLALSGLQTLWPWPAPLSPLELHAL